MSNEHAEAFEYDTLGERAVALAHQLAGRRGRSYDEVVALGPGAGAFLLAELTETLAVGLGAVALSMLATGRAVARAADGQPEPIAASSSSSVSEN